MNNLSTGRSFFRGRFLLLLGACLSVYFSYHAIAGQRSVMRLVELERSLEVERQALETLQAEKQALHKKVVMLRPDSMDFDYVEELAARYLGYHDGGAITVLHGGGS